MVSDGASSNRRFCCISCNRGVQEIWWAPNIALSGNFIYFICDVPHLIKTTRNAWSNSTAKGTRNLEVNSLIINNIIEIICFEIGRLMVKRLSGHTLLSWLRNHGLIQPCTLERS